MIPAAVKESTPDGGKVYWPGYWVGFPAEWHRIKVALPFKTRTAALEAAKHHIDGLIADEQAAQAEFEAMPEEEYTGEPEPEAV